MEKILTTLLAALLPGIATLFSKLNKATVRKNALEDAQKKIEFVQKYFDAQSKLLPETELASVKVQLSGELYEVKNMIAKLDQKAQAVGYEKLHGVQKIFLTFKPANALGWLWAILFYIVFVCDLFVLMGLFVDDQVNLTPRAFLENIKDVEILVGVVVWLAFLLLFRWLAISNYRTHTAVAATRQAGVRTLVREKQAQSEMPMPV